MVSVFVLCAAMGGTVLVAQLIMSLLGLGGGHGHEGPMDLHAPDDGAGHGAANGSPLLGLFSLRAITTALTFFGLLGLAGTAGGLRRPLILLVALLGAAAGAALSIVLYRALHRLPADGTLRLREAIGQTAVVYLTIPGRRAGAGKVTLVLQGRTVECDAKTAQGELATGARVLIIDLLQSGTLLVERDPLDGAKKKE